MRYVRFQELSIGAAYVAKTVTVITPATLRIRVQFSHMHYAHFWKRAPCRGRFNPAILPVLKINPMHASKYLMKTQKILAILTIFLLVACTKHDYEKGEELYNKNDYAHALPLIMNSAKDGLKEAQLRLGVMYYYGNGVELDYKKATEWLTKAANQGDDRAQTNLGNIYYSGLGTEPDFKKSIYWYEKAASQNYSGAQTMLGLCTRRATACQRTMLRPSHTLRKPLRITIKKLKLQPNTHSA